MKIQIGTTGKQIISKLYKSLLSYHPYNTFAYKERWEAEMQVEITQENWIDICSEESQTQMYGENL